MSIAKRAIDLIVGLAVLILASPVLLVLAVGVRLFLGAPVFYRQERVGLNERVFRLWKFRTMTNARDAEGRLLPDAERLTPFGQFLRRWSLDELPQFINVVDGSMSLIGPRPLLIRYIPRYTPEQRRRHLVRPGLTGLAQVNGRNALTWDERFRHDVAYVDSWSLWLDLKIALKTIGVLFDRGGSGSAGGEVTGEFWGLEGPPASGVRMVPVEERESLQRGG